MMDSVRFKIGTPQVVKADAGKVRVVPVGAPAYDGSYSVVPSETPQVLQTRGKQMLSDLTVEEIPQGYIVPSGSQTLTENDVYDVTDLAQVVVEVPKDGGSSMNVQFENSCGRGNAATYTDTEVSLTITVSGTYSVSWSAFRSSTASGTQGSQLYINGEAYDDPITSWTLSYCQNPVLTGVQLAQGDVISVYVRCRSTSNYVLASNLIAVQTA